MGYNDRIKEIRKHLNLSQSQFAKELGLKQGSYSDIERGRTGISTHVKNILQEKYNINTLWLDAGHGEMILPAGIIQEMDSIKAEFASELEQIEEQSERAEFLLKTTSIVPLLPIAAQAGRISEFMTSEYSCEKVVSPMTGIDFVITVAGDSMAPNYPSGTQLFVKRVDEKAFINWGKVYVLDTANGAVIKKIMPGSDETKINCVSINSDYPAFEVRIEDVFGMYLVKLSMSVQ